MSFSQAWVRFCAAGQTLGPTPGVREGWHRGRPWYSVWLVRIVDDAVRQRVRQVRQALGDAVAPVPEDSLHITAWVAGFPASEPTFDDDIALDALQEQADTLRAAVLPPLRLGVAGAGAFTTCAILEVTDPHGDLAALRQHLGGGAPEVRFAPFLPHITIGRFPRTADNAPLIAALTPLRALPPIPIRPARIERVVFATDRPDAPLTTVDAVGFGAG